MTDDPERAIETMRSGLQDGEYDVSDAERKLLLDVSDQIRILGPAEYSAHRHEFLLRRGLTLAKECDADLADAVEDRDTAESVVAYINTAKTGSPETNKDYRVAFRGIAKLATDEDGIPEAVSWVPGGYPGGYDPTPDPADMLRWDEDIQPMLDACKNLRDRALVALAWDLGPRPSELFDLEVGDISDHEYGLQVRIEHGKTGSRSPVLVPSVPYVKRWLDVHPGDGDDALWCKLTGTDSISNNRIRDALKEVADRADVDKPVTPTAFRKSSASFLASQGVSQAHLEDHHGWERGSDIAARYIATFDDAGERAIASAHGVEVADDEPADISPVPCPRCGQETPRDRDECVFCGQAMSASAVEEQKRVRSDIREGAVEEPGEVARALAEIGDLVDEYPFLADQL